MPQQPQPHPEFALARKQIILGLVVIFAIYFRNTYFIQTFTVAKPRMAADLNAMALYAWSISIPSLAAAFVTFLPILTVSEVSMDAVVEDKRARQPVAAEGKAA